MSLNCSDATAAEVDAEIVEILKESYEKALAMLRENRELMDKLAEYLIEKETITGKEFMAIFRKEKGLPDPEEEKEGESGAKAEKKSEEGVSAEATEKKEELANGEKEEAVAEEASVEDATRVEAEADAEKKASVSGEGKSEPEQPAEDNRPVGRFSNGKID